MDIRTIFSNNGTLDDFTTNINNYHAGAKTIDFVAAEDKLYIGQRFPFNSLYFKFGTANTASSVLTVAVWDGSNWSNVVETFDETISSGASFGQDGYISWGTDRNESWSREDTQTSGGNELVTGLGSAEIYDHYWVRFSFSADLDAGTTMSFVGPLFGDDNDLGAEYPDLTLSATKSGWESGKTDWEEQFIYATRKIIRELKARQIIFHQGQILNRDDFRAAAVYKVAEIAYRQMGPRFVGDKDEAKSLYADAMKNIFPIIDRDLDGNIDTAELDNPQGRLTRGNFFNSNSNNGNGF